MSSSRLYWPALIVSTVASFMFEAAWFSIFLKQWLAGIGRTQVWLMSAAGYNPVLQFGTALACSLVAAIVLSLLTQWTGLQTARRGMLMGIVVWVGFVATSWAKEYVFEVRTLQIFAINTVYTLLDLILLGAITGGWRGKARAD